jgi:polar amino acid transport system substrate-binding protein
LLKRFTFVLAVTALAAAGAQAAELPPRIKSRGSIVAAVVPNYPPLEMRDPASGTLIGFDIELGNALAEKLGVKMQWQETSFEQMLSAVRTGRVDIIMSGMSDLPARQETASFIDYVRSGTQFLTQAGRAPAAGPACQARSRNSATQPASPPAARPSRSSAPKARRMPVPS